MLSDAVGCRRAPGATEKPVNGGMPGFGEDQLSDADLGFIVLHERELGGENPDTEDAEALEEVALLLSENPEMTLADALEEVGVEAPETEDAGSGGDPDQTETGQDEEIPVAGATS